MIVLAIDPGPEASAYVVFDSERQVILAKNPQEANDTLVDRIALRDGFGGQHLAIEMIQPMGMVVGREVFGTAFFVGRCVQAFGPDRSTRLTRVKIKTHLCGSVRAKDANIRQRLIDIFGGVNAIGCKKAPGPLYGVTSHCWAALAVAVTFCDLYAVEQRIKRDNASGGIIKREERLF